MRKNPPHFLALFLLVPLLLLIGACSSEERALGPNAINLIVGTASSEKGQGLYQVAFDKELNKFSSAKRVGDLNRATFGFLSAQLKKLYFIDVDAKGQGRVSSFDAGSALDLTSPTQQISSNGEGLTYISLSHSGRFLAVAHYRSATVAVFTLDESGQLIGEAQILKHTGKGKDPKRQESPHPHWVEWAVDDSFLYAIDLGIDQVMAYPFDSESGRAGTGFTALTTRPGDGPRHMALHPAGNWAYVITELTNELVFAEISNDGVMTEQQRISSLKTSFEGVSQAAHIALNNDGTRLYVSNRGANNIGVFEIAADGRLVLLQHVGTGGDWPRFFVLLENENLLLVGNQRSNSISAFRIDEKGLLSDLDASVKVLNPAYITAFGGN